MKEIWTYMKELFPEDKKRIKKLKKAENAKDYEQAVAELLLYFKREITYNRGNLEIENERSLQHGKSETARI